MGKGSVLGNDPLGWMKIANENKKLFPLENENTVDLNNEKSNQQITIKQQIPISANSKEISDTQIQQPISEVNDDSGSIIMPKQKVLIGRLYEKPTEKVKSMQSREIVFQGSKNYTETSFSGSRIQQKKKEPEMSRIPISTYIIIAYTALMLVLGYLVYNDLSKQTSRIEARLFAIEKVLRLK
ncbi:MAG: hypothetical protein L3J17_09225 [Candidatus Jettenia sp.]|nr:MAG: hypothetical protein L3J17_09225 [Candidatus Jettenia sp.]